MSCVFRHAVTDGQFRRSHASVYVRRAGCVTLTVDGEMIANVCARVGIWTGDSNSGTYLMPMLHPNNHAI